MSKIGAGGVKYGRSADLTAFDHAIDAFDYAKAHDYSFEFLEWKKQYVLREHWLAHNKKICPRCNIPYTRAYLGKTNRRTFFCERCQKKYE